MINPIVDIIFGGQFGSEGKRLFNEYHYLTERPDAIVSNFGPNSGGFVSDGGKWATFAMGADCLHLLSPGSIINLKDFEAEMARLPKGADVLVHENAAVVMDNHFENEKGFVCIGSTMTGTAAAGIQKMLRNPDKVNTAKVALPDRAISARDWFNIMRSCKKIQLSVPQGHSLSINHGFYPYCTSRNTSPQQALADAGIPIQWVRKIIACMRTYPIRVSNRFDNNDNMIGYSGPYYPDQFEMTWDEVGQKPEMTSVSKKVRRVFSFSLQQYRESCQMNGVTDVFLNFANYLPKVELDKLFKEIQDISGSTKVSWLGFGPTVHDIATVKEIVDTDEIDDREGCHSTIVG
jgi:adenylosuccinate synthase